MTHFMMFRSLVTVKPRSSLERYYTPVKQLLKDKGKGKTDPLQAWSGPESSRKLMFPDFVTTAWDRGKVVSLSRRLP